jgi:hypothetical protein
MVVALRKNGNRNGDCRLILCRRLLSVHSTLVGNAQRRKTPQFPVGLCNSAFEFSICAGFNW